MDKIGFVLPVLPGKSEVVTTLAQTMMGGRKDEYQATNAARQGASKEAWFLQPTPDGNAMLLVYLEGTDIVTTLVNYGASQDSFTPYYRQQVQEATGIDFSQPMAGLPSETLLDWSSDEDSAQYAALALPVPGANIEALKALAGTMSGERKAEFTASQADIGIAKESWYFQATPDGNGLWIVYMEGPNPWEAMGKISSSQSAFDVWFKQQVIAINGVDLNVPMTEAPSQLIMSSPRGL